MLDLDLVEIPGLMRDCQITSRFEGGEGEDKGHFGPLAPDDASPCRAL